MNETRKAIVAYLLTQSDFLDMLALNAPYYDPDGTASKVNSIIPSDMLKSDFNLPFITIDEGNDLLIGETLSSETFFIRCYNDINKSHYESGGILDAIREILDDVQLTLETNVLVRLRWESTLVGLQEPDLMYKSKTSRYRALVL